MSKKILEVTDSELRNIVQALDLLHSKCMDNIHALAPFGKDATEMKQYFKEKQSEITNQRIQTNKLLTNG